MDLIKSSLYTNPTLNLSTNTCLLTIYLHSKEIQSKSIYVSNQIRVTIASNLAYTLLKITKLLLTWLAKYMHPRFQTWLNPDHTVQRAKP